MATKRSSTKATQAATATPAQPVRKRVAPKAAAPKAKPVQPPAPAASKPVKTVKSAKPAKKTPKPRPVLVRDGFTMPAADFALIATLKSRALQQQHAAKKSELLRAGLHALAALDGPTLVALLSGLETVKTGRPKKGH